MILRDSCVLCRQGTVDRYGVIQYKPEQLIRCTRTAPQRVYRKGAKGEYITYVATYITKEIVELGDNIDGCKVVSVQPLRDLSGTLQGYKVVIDNA